MMRHFILAGKIEKICFSQAHFTATLTYNRAVRGEGSELCNLAQTQAYSPCIPGCGMNQPGGLGVVEGC